MRIIRAISLLAQKKKNKPRGRQSENATRQPEVNFFLLSSKVAWQQDTIMVIKCSANVVQHIPVFFSLHSKRFRSSSSIFFCSLSNFGAITRLETLATQAKCFSTKKSISYSHKTCLTDVSVFLKMRSFLCLSYLLLNLFAGALHFLSLIHI